MKLSTFLITVRDGNDNVGHETGTCHRDASAYSDTHW